MTDTPSHEPGQIHHAEYGSSGPQDFVGGLALMAVSHCLPCGRRSDLQGMHGFSFGPGTAPRMFAVLLLGLGAAVVVVGIVHRRSCTCRRYPGAVRCS